MEPVLIVAFAAVTLTGAALFIDFLQTMAIRRINQKVEREAEAFEQRGSVGDQIGDWLMEKEEGEGKPTNLELLSAHVGQALFQSLKASSMAQMSGDSRHQKMVDEKLYNGVSAQDPQMAILNSFLERVGLTDLLNAQELPYVLNWLRKNKGLGLNSMPEGGRLP